MELTMLLRDVLSEIADAFEWRESRARDEQWLPSGFTHIMSAILDFDDLNEETLWAVALLMSVMERGGTCLPLSFVPSIKETSRLPDELQALDVEGWKKILVGDAFGDGGTHVRPLVVANDRLYFDRFLRLERDVAMRLLEPLGVGALPEPANWIDEVGRIFEDDLESALQKEAALKLFENRVAILAGGPGTGKTTTVAKLLISLHRATAGTFSVKLCAPTGKAAQRIRESLVNALQEHAPEIASEISHRLIPTTIHKLLSIRPAAARRRRTDPLHVDFIICDETSMVDLALLDELLRAVAPESRLLLVGDPNQLQSVDVGTVMSDLVAATQLGLPGTTLDTVFRVSADGGLDEQGRETILSFFKAIRHDDVAEALRLLDTGTSVITHVDVTNGSQLASGGDELFDLVFERADALMSLGESNAPREDWRSALESTMVLAAQHKGPFSRTWWVDHITKHLEIRLGPAPSVVGVPVLITATDHSNGVTNGDTGLIVRSADGRPTYQPAILPSTAAVDDAQAGALSPTAIHDWQAWWAMTIHKSQGSEFDQVIVSITPGTRLISKELLYTAVTRAKKRVIIVGLRSDIEKALRTPARRFSGLAEIIEENYRSKNS
jgi:exodeoxyribonuclease V alpha subunit